MLHKIRLRTFLRWIGPTGLIIGALSGVLAVAVFGIFFRQSLTPLVALGLLIVPWTMYLAIQFIMYTVPLVIHDIRKYIRRRNSRG